MSKIRHKAEILIIVAGLALGTFGIRVFQGPVAATFAFFYLLSILSAVTAFGLYQGIAVGLLGALISLPYALNDPVIQESQNYTLYITLHVSLPVAFAFIAYELVYRYEKQKEEIASLSSSRVKMARALDEELTRFRLLYQISQKLQTHLSLDAASEALLNAILKVTNARACSVWILDEQQGKLHCIGALGPSTENWKNIKLSPGEGIAGTAFKKEKAIRIDNLQENAMWENVLKRKGRFRCALAVPLKVSGKFSGAITVLDKIGEPRFTSSDEKLLSLLSLQIAITLENTRLYQELTNQLEHISSLFEVAQSLIEIVDLGKLFQVIIKSAVTICEADAGYLLIKDENDVLHPKAFVGILPGFAETLIMEKGKKIAGRVLETNKSVCVFTLKELLELREREVHWEDISSAIWVPLLLDHQAQGVMCIYRKRDKPPLNNEHKGALETLCGLASLAIEKSSLYEDLVNTNIKAVQALSIALDAREPYSARKQKVAQEFIEEFAKHLSLSDQEKSALELAANLYDIGKIGIPDTILNKKDPLTSDEINYIRRHVHIGADIVGAIDFLKNAVPYVFLHHERFDGKGYPLGLKGEDIPKGARILAVIDSYLSMRQERPYRQARSHKEAITELRNNKGAAFDPEVLEVFETILSNYNHLEV